ncbi:galactose-3-O-sulfotransferase 2-like [Ambystoma mexicanum]|uniref:galactose-3-O-sulfotransferase 2-like n=1 Tax=Ambystoma mexicanum TaxID=8296 RepID=UPI0037E8F359
MRIFPRKPRVPGLLLYVLCTLLGFTLREQLFLLDGLYQRYVRKVPFQKTISSRAKICHPHTNVMFLKTHKTASSTVMNIMYRFTEKYNLSIALPVDGMSLFHYPRPFQAKYVEGFLAKKPGQLYNIICNHLTFNFSEVQKVVPNTTIYLSILRNPVSLLESSYSYFRFLPSFQKSKTLEEFLASPQSFYNPNEPYHMLVKNTMWYDFGYDNNAEDTDSYIQSVLREIEQRFQLVLIAEYFDESMVLLKNTLCWDMEDVVSFKLNSRSKDSIQDLSEKSKEKAKEWCSLDWKLYQHFNRTFWRRIHETIGEENLEKELKLLRSKQEEFRDQCLQEGEAIRKKQIKDPKLMPAQAGVAHILGYNLRQGLESDLYKVCHRMVIPEHHYRTLMLKYQFPR